MISMLQQSRRAEPIMVRLVCGGQIITLRLCSIRTVTISRRSSAVTDTSDQGEAAGAEVILIATVADLRITAGPSCPIKVLGFQLRYTWHDGGRAHDRSPVRASPRGTNRLALLLAVRNSTAAPV